MSNNQVHNSSHQDEVDQPPAEVEPAADVSSAINGGIQEQNEPPAKEPAANELITTNQVHEPNLLTDQEVEAEEPSKQAEQLDQPLKSEDNSKPEEDTGDHSPFAPYKKDIDQSSLAAVEEQIKHFHENIVKFEGIHCSLQQVLPVPDRDGWIIAVTLFNIPEDVKSSKLVEA